MSTPQTIIPCLWFDTQAEQAAQLYTSIFPNSRITAVSRYGDEGHEIHGRPSGTVMTVAFDLGGQAFTALNGGPAFRFNEAISLQVHCESQEEVDYYWEKLSEGGDPAAQRCGWLKDRFGLSWQVFPKRLVELVGSGESERSQRVMGAMLQMRKIDITDLERAYAG